MFSGIFDALAERIYEHHNPPASRTEVRISYPVPISRILPCSGIRSSVEKLNMILGAILAVYGEVKPGIINDPNLTC
jgi:hypothetical protein